MKTFKEFFENSEVLTEMPRMIRPLKNTKEKVSKVWDNAKSSGDYNEITDFHLNGNHLIEFDNQILLIDKDWKECTYYVNLENVSNLHNKAIRQVYLWRDVNSFAPITSIVFWDILLPKFKCIVTDAEQTEHGKQFWIRRLTEAFRMNLNVSRVNQRTKLVIKLNDMKDVFDSEHEIWGSTSKHGNELLMICKG